MLFSPIQGDCILWFTEQNRDDSAVVNSVPVDATHLFHSIQRNEIEIGGSLSLISLCHSGWVSEVHIYALCCHLMYLEITCHNDKSL